MRAWALRLMVVMMIATSGYAETLKMSSVRLDEDDVRPFFDRLIPVIEGGFGPAERDGLAKWISSMKDGDEGNRRYPVTYEGRKVPLRVHAVMGSHRAARIELSTSPELADRIRKEANVFLDELDR